MEVIVFVGLQASGKSTFYRERFASSHVLVSKDLYGNARNKTRRQDSELRNALQQGKSVVVDNTNASVEQRALLVSVARAASARVVGYYFASKVSDCLARNASRMGSARVPDVAVLATAKKLARPTHGEGFDELWYVTLSESDGFVVAPWEEA